MGGTGLRMKLVLFGFIFACMVIVFSLYIINLNSNNDNLKNSTTITDANSSYNVNNDNVSDGKNGGINSSLNTVIPVSNSNGNIAVVTASSGDTKNDSAISYNVPTVDDSSGPKAESGDISISVLTSDNKPIYDAKVTLIKMISDDSTRTFHVSDTVGVKDNPLTRSNAGNGLYSFKNVLTNPEDSSWGYSVMIELDGRMIEIPVMVGEESGIYYNENWDKLPDNLTNNTIFGFVKQYMPSLGRSQIVSGAKVTLYRCTGYGQSGTNTNLGLANVPNNPQMSIENGSPGFFRFDGLEPGYYNVVSEKDGLSGSYIVNLTGRDAGKYEISNPDLH